MEHSSYISARWPLPITQYKYLLFSEGSFLIPSRKLLSATALCLALWKSLVFPALPLEGDLHELSDFLCCSLTVTQAWHPGSCRVSAGGKYIRFALSTGVSGTEKADFLLSEVLTV